MKKIIVILILITAVVFGGRYVFNNNIISSEDSASYLAQVAGSDMYELGSSVPKTVTLGQSFNFNVLTKAPINGYTVSLTDLSGAELYVLKTYQSESLQTGFKGISVTIPANVAPGAYMIKFTGKIDANTGPRGTVGISKINVIGSGSTGSVQPPVVTPATNTNNSNGTPSQTQVLPDTSNYNLSITPVPGKPYLYRFTWSGLPSQPAETRLAQRMFIVGYPSLDNRSVPILSPTGFPSVNGSTLIPRPTAFNSNDLTSRSDITSSGSYDFYIPLISEKKLKVNFDFFISYGSVFDGRKKFKTITVDIPAVNKTAYKYKDGFTYVSNTVKRGEKLYIRMPKAENLPFPYQKDYSGNNFAQLDIFLGRQRDGRWAASFDKSNIDLSKFSSEGLVGITIPSDIDPAKNYITYIHTPPYYIYIGQDNDSPLLKITK